MRCETLDPNIYGMLVGVAALSSGFANGADFWIIRQPEHVVKIRRLPVDNPSKLELSYRAIGLGLGFQGSACTRFCLLSDGYACDAVSPPTIL
jgi:hypothetical protein